MSGNGTPAPAVVLYFRAGHYVVPGAREKKFPAGTYSVSCALIIGQRTASTSAPQATARLAA